MTNDNDSTFQDPASEVQEIDRLKAENARLMNMLPLVLEAIKGALHFYSPTAFPRTYKDLMDAAARLRAVMERKG